MNVSDIINRKVYEGALENAKAILDKANATQEEVDAAIRQLADAADKLVAKTSVTPKPENNNNSNTGSGNKPVTGDSATPIVLLAAVLASVFAVVRQMKKKIIREIKCVKICIMHAEMQIRTIR